MPSYAMVQADAFTSEMFRGNPAAVLVLDAFLPDRLMQAIAMENNLAETAFLAPNGEGWDLRWFTPTEEVPFCGHATLASAHVLAERHGVSGPMRFFTRKVGDIVVTREAGRYTLDLPRFDPVEDVAEDAFVQRFRPKGWVRTFRNFENFFFELGLEEDVATFEPDMAGLTKLGSWGLCITAPGDTVDFVSRYFVPGGGIPEDPVTGSNHATLAPFWAARLGRQRLLAHQISKRGGVLDCEVLAERVHLTGDAVIYMDAVIHLPDNPA